MQDAVRLARPSSVQQPIEALKQKHCVLNMECSLQASVVDASVKLFSALMKPYYHITPPDHITIQHPRTILPYNTPGPYSQSVSIPRTTCFCKFNFNINTRP